MTTETKIHTLQENLQWVDDMEHKATRGPWRWFIKKRMQEIYLATEHWGRIFVMQFARWGFRSATPRFQLWKNRNWEDPFHGDGVMKQAHEFCKFDHNSEDKWGVRHPDAQYIEISRNLAPHFIKLAKIVEDQDRNFWYNTVEGRKMDVDKKTAMSDLNQAIEWERERHAS